jgi:uncharacterized membrane protein
MTGSEAQFNLFFNLFNHNTRLSLPLVKRDWLIKSESFTDVRHQKVRTLAQMGHFLQRMTSADGRCTQHDRLRSIDREARGVIFFRGAETHSRSVLKAISWRTLGTLDTFAISWFFTGRVEIAGSIAGVEIVTKIAWYYLHERVWAAIPWGRRRLD